MDAGRERHIGPVGDDIQDPMAQNGCEQYPRTARITAQPEVGQSEQGGPDRIHQQAVAESDIRSGEIISGAGGLLELHMLNARDHKDAPQQVGQHGCKHGSTERESRLNPLGGKACGEVSDEHGALLMLARAYAMFECWRVGLRGAFCLGMRLAFAGSGMI